MSILYTWKTPGDQQLEYIQFPAAAQNVLDQAKIEELSFWRHVRKWAKNVPKKFTKQIFGAWFTNKPLI